MRFALSCLLLVPLVALSQVQDRVNRNAYPLTGYDATEVREVLSRIQSLNY